MNEQKTAIWYKGEPRIFQDLSLEEQEDFWKEIEENANRKSYILIR